MGKMTENNMMTVNGLGVCVCVWICFFYIEFISVANTLIPWYRSTKWRISRSEQKSGRKKRDYTTCMFWYSNENVSLDLFFFNAVFNRKQWMCAFRVQFNQSLFSHLKRRQRWRYSVNVAEHWHNAHTIYQLNLFFTSSTCKPVTCKLITKLINCHFIFIDFFLHSSFPFLSAFFFIISSSFLLLLLISFCKINEVDSCSI